MRKVSKFLISTLLILTGGTLLFLRAQNEARILHRDPKVLLDRFYLLKKSNREAAIKSLVILLKQEQHHTVALKELSQLYLEENNYKAAAPLVLALHHQSPNNAEYRYLLATMYYEKGSWEQAYPLLLGLTQSREQNFKVEAQNLLNQMASSVPTYQEGAQSKPVEEVLNQKQPQFTNILLSQFYQLKSESPKQAEQLLDLLDLMNTDNATIPMEIGYLHIQKNNNAQAINYFLQAYNKQPNPATALQLAYLYVTQNNYKEAEQYFLLAMRADNEETKSAAARGYQLSQQTLNPQKQVTLEIKSKEQVLLDHFYLLKKTNKKNAWVLINQIIRGYPNNLLALKEAGFLAIDLDYRAEAISCFTRAYELSRHPEIAMQLGYLYDQPDNKTNHTNNKYLAYHYFNLATFSNNKELELRAQNALTNLAGLQTKTLPSPLFSEIFYTPFSQTRFGLTVRPFIARFGIESKNKWQTKLYFVLRQTEDNKSFSSGQIPQIYEDNVRVTGLGLQITPFPAIPMVGFIEAGRAYDLVYRARDRWRNDVRSGLMYYNEFGARPAYWDKLQINLNYYSTLYADFTYFSRYNNNFIGTIKTHQGIRLAQYHSTMLNLYVTGRVIEDTNRDFFNNIAEVGPGVGFIPSNRYPVELRFEHIKGQYLPQGKTDNPYPTHYTNNTVQFFFYVKL
jgi:tetratricopeptide (TPR) repeat protein